MFCGKLVTIFPLAAFVEPLDIFIIFFLIEVAEIFQSTTLESHPTFQEGAYFLAPVLNDYSPPVTEQHVSWLCQLWTYLEPFIYLQPRLWLI